MGSWGAWMHSYQQLCWRNLLMNMKRMRPSGWDQVGASSSLFPTCPVLQELEGLQISRLNPDSNQISVDRSDLWWWFSWSGWCSFRMSCRCLALAFRYLRKVARTVLRKSLSRTCRLGAWVSWNITSLAKCSSDTWSGRKADSRCRVLRSGTWICFCNVKIFSKSYPAILMVLLRVSVWCPVHCNACTVHGTCCLRSFELFGTGMLNVFYFRDLSRVWRCALYRFYKGFRGVCLNPLKPCENRWLKVSQSTGLWSLHWHWPWAYWCFDAKLHDGRHGLGPCGEMVKCDTMACVLLVLKSLDDFQQV